MHTALPKEKALLAAPADPKPPASEVIVKVAREHRVSPIRQMREMFSLQWGPGKLAFHEYYSSGSFHPDLNPNEKRQFVGEKGSTRLNIRLSPIKKTPSRAFIRDKVLYSSLLQQLGLRTTQTQAVAVKSRSYGNIRTVRNQEALADFLLNTAEYPLFGKPIQGSKSVGSALINDVDRDAGRLLLHNGLQVDVHSFAAEVFDDFEHGFTFQSAILQHPDIRRMTGDVVGTLRLVTVRDDSGVETLYCVWKLPPPDAMSDNFWQAGSMVAEVDVDTGRLVKCRRGSGLNSEWVEKHPTSGLTFSGYQIPHWAETKALAARAHDLFPEFGVFGWDVAVTPEGPLIIECNANPFHALYQIATGRGILNNEFKPRLDAVARCSEKPPSAH